ncbi:LCP family protein [Gracilibacillus caseinilyticus]|uniref:LCP family protein n=1 Tax=Gracilibacillus caseinilyticus TaxID=2932256 RepID=A0ABY4F1P3_9BACI|nr:LCP family protein [Gracilibacillus caseinilyticus]UOQ50404.1 LCP family protein [Gracilibacillus caseinilyticus]
MSDRLKKRSNKYKRKLLLWFLFVVFLLVLSCGTYIFVQVYTATKGAYEEIDRQGNKSEYREEEVTFSKDPISILLIGVDYGVEGKNGRADTLMVVTLNPSTKKTTLTTVPRDTRVEFYESEAQEYAGFHKINAAYSYGSIFEYGSNKLTIEKVEELLDIPIDEYVALDFDAFHQLVDTFGGVTVDVKQPFSQKSFKNDGKMINFDKGIMKMNGEEALAFVRMRKHAANTLYSREERQRQFVQAVINEALSTTTFLKIAELSNVLENNIKTSLSPSEILQLQKAYASMDNVDVQTFEIEGQNEVLHDIYYFIPEEESLLNVSEQIKQELALP